MAGGGLRGAMGIVSLILIAGALVLMFFVVLSGVTDQTPLNKTWFLRADTSSFPGSGRAQSYWTYWKICADGGADCGASIPSLPFGAAWIGGTDGVPGGLIGSHYKNTTSMYYYYMWRFGWVFYLISLVFAVLAFFTALLAPCSRLASGLSGFMLAVTLFFFTIAASLMTAVFVKGRNQFRDAGISASIGRYAFGFTWGAWAALFLAMLFLFLGCGASRKDKSRKNVHNDDQIRTVKTKRTGGGFGNVGFFRRQRHSTRSTRGSFVDTESQRRVKEEY